MEQKNNTSQFLDVAGSEYSIDSIFPSQGYYNPDDITIPNALEDYGISYPTVIVGVFLTALVLYGVMTPKQAEALSLNPENICSLYSDSSVQSANVQQIFEMVSLNPISYLDTAKYLTQQCPTVKQWCNPTTTIAVPQTNGCVVCIPKKGVIPMDPNGLNPQPRATYVYPTPVRPNRPVPRSTPVPQRPRPTQQKVPNSQNG